MPAPRLLQRKCACGAKPAAGPCPSCADSPGGRQPESAVRSDVAPPSVGRILRMSGQPLDRATRQDMEQRFAHDFTHVRVHRGAEAERSAREVGALAYTVGSDVVFGAGQYRPETSSGRFTLAHELAHVVQQQGGGGALARRTAGGSGTIAIGRADDGAERDADRAAEAALRAPPAERGRATKPVAIPGGGSAPVLRRLLLVNPRDVIPLPMGFAGPPEPLTNAVSRLIRDTCPQGQFNVNAGTGAVADGNGMCALQAPPLAAVRRADASNTPVGCGCICDIIADARTTTIAFGAGGPFTTPTSPSSVPNASPGTGGSPSNTTVSIDPRFRGQYLINGNWTDVPFHLLFAHELCGHARPLMRGTQVPPGAGPPGGIPPHEVYSVDVERQIAAEHNPALPRRPDDYGGGARQRP